MTECNQGMESWQEYVRRVSGGLTQVEIAVKTGIAQSNVGRWLRGEPGAPKAESAVALARAFNQPPIEALVAAGYLTAEEAGVKAQHIRPSLREFAALELLGELVRRESAADERGKAGI
jgi:transcriptional regulator with XRE-family HTH domain